LLNKVYENLDGGRDRKVGKDVKTSIDDGDRKLKAESHKQDGQ
jgi:hypothetical protein